MNQNPHLAGSASFGIDVGHSAVKIAASMLDQPTQRHTARIPTVVIPALKIADEHTAQLAQRETVTIGGASYFFGETAVLQGNSTVFSGQDRNWIETTVHDVMVVGAFRKAMELIRNRRPQHINLVLGLPMAYFSSQKEILRARVTALLEPFLLPGQLLTVLVRPQSMVPLINLQYAEDGTLSPHYQANSESWAVIDIGHFTTDFCILLRTQIQDIGGDSIPGVSKAYSAIRSEFQARGYSVVLESIDEAIKRKAIRHFGEVDVSDIVEAAVQPLRDIIIDRAQTLFSDVAARLNGIVVAGGGAPLVFDAIKAAFPNALAVPAPALALAEGMCRFGLYAHHVRSAKARAA